MKLHKKVQSKNWSNVPPKLLACVRFLYKVVHKIGRLRKFNRARVLFTPSLGRVQRLCRGLEKFFPPVLQRCYGCSFDAQEIVHTGHGMLGFFSFFSFFFWRETCLPKVS